MGDMSQSGVGVGRKMKSPREVCVNRNTAAIAKVCTKVGEGRVGAVDVRGPAV